MTDNLRNAYQQTQLPHLQLGNMVYNNQLVSDGSVNLLLRSFNRHGLIAGATGTGKTKTIQVLCEQLSALGVPCLVMDMKGDVSGLAEAGVLNATLVERNQSMSLPFNPQGSAVELLSLEDSSLGVPLRTTIHEFGALLFCRLLELNETQMGVVTILFEYVKRRNLKIITLGDFKALLQFAQTADGKADIETQFGAITNTTLSIIMRKIIELEAEGTNQFFGEPAFDSMDLLRTSQSHQGIISILRVMNLQEHPKLFSTFMLKLLSDLYLKLPEVGDLDKPKLVLFIDEAHLIFKNANKALLNLLQTIVKLIRSKGIGLIFCTQSPKDIPDEILNQLGLKIQHALRAFTAKDRQEIKLVAQNFPISADYSTADLLTSLDIGDALITGLNEKGQPTPLVQCRIRAPQSRMGVLTEQESAYILSRSTLMKRYKQPMRISSTLAKQLTLTGKTRSVSTKKSTAKKSRATNEPSVITTLSKNTLVRQVIRQIFRELTNNLLKALSMKKR